MSHTKPKSKSIIGYKEIYFDKPPENRVSLLKGLCKNVVLGEIAGLKNKLKPKEQKYHDTSDKVQRAELLYFCGSNKFLFAKYDLATAKFFQNNDCIIFSRPLCLYAFEEIRNSDLPVISGFTMANSWESLLKYLLAVNNELTKLTTSKTNSDYVDEKEIFDLETLNPKLLPLNELVIEVDPLLTLVRGYKLFQFLSVHEEFGIHLTEYFNSFYGITFDKFIYELLGLLYTNNRNGENNIVNSITGEVLDVSFYYTIQDLSMSLFTQLSNEFNNEIPERLLSIKKFPFYKIDLNTYLLIDSVLLLEKSYSQFINDFWFDRISLITTDREKKRYSIQKYRSVIGYFFEEYIRNIIAYSFENAKFWVIKTFKELEVTKHGQLIELADVYVRHNKKIFLGQVKSTSLYDAEKYAGEIEGLYKNDRAAFFKSFGIDQLIASIQNLSETVIQIDSSFPTDKHYKIYPSIIINEKALQTPVMAQIFNQRFLELLASVSLNKKITVFALSVIHVSDFEQMEEFLNKNPNLFWKVLDRNKEHPKFIPPFFATLTAAKIIPTYKRAISILEPLVLKYQPTTGKTKSINFQRGI